MARSTGACAARCALAAVLLLVAACGGGTNLTGDGSLGDTVVEDAGDDVVEGDVAAEADDVAAWDELDVGEEGDGPEASCSTPSFWELNPRTIDSVELLGTPTRFGTTDRLRIQVQMISACDRLGRVDLSVSSGDATDSVTVSAFAWAPRGIACPPSAPLVPWIVEVEGRLQGNLHVVVLDGDSPGGGLRLEYDREAGCSGVPECACYAGTPAGDGAEWSDCLTDCSCAWGLSCIVYWGVAGPLSNCVRPCNDLLDCCRAPPCREGDVCLGPVPDGAPYVCSTLADQCATNDDCPDGFECVRDTADAGNRCVDRRELPRGMPCSCDEECGAGLLCASVRGEAPTCEIPCLRLGDCPRHTWFWFCDDAGGVCEAME